MTRDWMWFKGDLPGWDFGGAVYALYRDSLLIYIGHTGNARARLLEHRRRFGFDMAKVAPMDKRRDRQRLERKLLFRLRPQCNGTLPSVLRPFGFYKGC